MAQVTPRRTESTARNCGECSACCTVLRVDALQKLGGTPCRHLRRDGPGCAIHPRRPGICRGYRCLWLQGGLEEGDRPDRLGAVLDLVTRGASTQLEVHELAPGALDASPRLRAVVERFRATLAVRVHSPGDPRDPDRPFRVLMPGGEEQRVRGERVATLRRGELVDERRLPWLDRLARRGALRWRAWRLRRAR